jgi:hypothetical protein
VTVLVFLEIGNLFLEIGKNGPYLALGMGPNIGPVRLDEKALIYTESDLFDRLF